MENKKETNYQYIIENIEGYPENGKHLECFINLPFIIVKGEDGFSWYDKKGKKHNYNMFKNENKIDERWIVTLDKENSNDALKNIFETKVNKDLNKIIKYCVKIYKKSLLMELKRIKEEFKV